MAALAGVAKSTASRVINGESTLSIREDTRQRVVAAVESLGYRPDQRAQALRTKRSRLLGLVVNEFDNPAFSSIIRGAQAASIDRDYSLLIAFVDPSHSEEALYGRLLEEGRVDGLLVTTIGDADSVSQLRARNVPHVLVNRQVPGAITSVMLDFASGVAKGVDHLAELGHRRLAFISGPLATYTGRTRHQGFRTALETLGLIYDPAMVIECSYDWSEAGDAFERLWRTATDRPTAICAANSVVASGIIMGARRIGVSVPADVSVLALLDMPLAQMHSPAISAVQFPFVDLGRAAANRLIDLIEGRRRPDLQILSDVAVIARESTDTVRAE